MPHIRRTCLAFHSWKLDFSHGRTRRICKICGRWDFQIRPCPAQFGRDFMVCRVRRILHRIYCLLFPSRRAHAIPRHVQLHVKGASGLHAGQNRQVLVSAGCRNVMEYRIRRDLQGPDTVPPVHGNGVHPRTVLLERLYDIGLDLKAVPHGGPQVRGGVRHVVRDRGSWCFSLHSSSAWPLQARTVRAATREDRRGRDTPGCSRSGCLRRNPTCPAVHT